MKWRDEIVEGLREKRYFHLRESIEEGDFERIVDRLGTCLRREDVRLYLSQRGVHQPEPLAFHTDQPYVDLIAWQCHRADPEGPTLLFNLGEVVREMDPLERRKLEEVIFYYPDPDVRSRLTAERLLEVRDGRLRLFYMPWHVSRRLPPLIQSAWGAFFDRAEERARSSSFGATLKEGECLFIDNKTMVHGRPAISPRSSRFLRRVWIKSTLVPGLPA